MLNAIGSEGQITRKFYQRRLPENPMEDYYFIHRLTGQTQPLLVEYGFIDNANDANKLQNNLLDYVEAVVKALADYSGYSYQPPNDGKNYYTVKKGDSLWSIANQFGVTVSELKQFNNLDSDSLTIGQILKIPISEESSPSENSTYVVQRGDSLWLIANRFGITVDELKRLNQLTTNTLQIGQVLIVPSQDLPEESSTYVVQSGDSLWSIANKFNTTVDELKRLNQLTTNLLQIGQVLIIPNNGEDSDNDNEEEILVYTVKRGDSLWSIANQFGVTVSQLIDANRLTSNVLSIGQQLVIPSRSSQRTYTVQKGDSLWLIANRFGVTVDELKQINNLTSNVLQIGQQLKIPS